MMPCCCGHDCARCVTYQATVRDDDALRARAQTFYRETFGRELPLEAFRCLGGRSEQVFVLCRECPWIQCCRKRGIAACEECGDYPCPELAAYREKYVNQSNII